MTEKEEMSNENFEERTGSGPGGMFPVRVVCPFSLRQLLRMLQGCLSILEAVRNLFPAEDQSANLQCVASAHSESCFYIWHL